MITTELHDLSWKALHGCCGIESCMRQNDARLNRLFKDCFSQQAPLRFLLQTIFAPPAQGTSGFLSGYRRESFPLFSYGQCFTLGAKDYTCNFINSQILHTASGGVHQRVSQDFNLSVLRFRDLLSCHSIVQGQVLTKLEKLQVQLPAQALRSPILMRNSEASTHTAWLQQMYR